MKQTIRKWIVTALIPFSIGLSVIHCGNDEGPMEEAGEAVDETVEEAGDKIEEATD